MKSSRAVSGLGRKNASVDQVLKELSKPPLFSRGPGVEDGQPISAALAWQCLARLSKIIIEEPLKDIYGKSLTSINNRASDMVIYDGIWRWSVYLHGEYLRGHRLVRAPDEWRDLFLSIEIIFTHCDKISGGWPVWMENTPLILRVLTELWRTGLTRGPERLKLQNKGQYTHPINTLIAANSELEVMWLETVGGTDKVVDILLGRIVHHSQEVEKNPSPSSFQKTDDQHELTEALEIASSLAEYSPAFRAGMIRRRGVRSIVGSPFLAWSLTPTDSNRSLIFIAAQVHTVLKFAIHSLEGLKQALSHGGVTTLNVAVQILIKADPLPLHLEDDIESFLDTINSNLLHYSILALVVKKLAGVLPAMGQNMKAAMILLPTGRAYEAINRLWATVSDRCLGSPYNSSTLRYIRRQICGRTECQVDVHTQSQRIPNNQIY